MFGLFNKRNTEKEEVSEIMLAILHMGFESVKQGGRGYRSVLEDVADKNEAERVRYFEQNIESIYKYLVITFAQVVSRLSIDPTLQAQAGFSRDEINDWFSKNKDKMQDDFSDFAETVLDWEIGGLLAFNVSANDILTIKKAIKEKDVETLKAYGLVRDAS